MFKAQRSRFTVVRRSIHLLVLGLVGIRTPSQGIVKLPFREPWPRHWAPPQTWFGAQRPLWEDSPAEIPMANDVSQLQFMPFRAILRTCVENSRNHTWGRREALLILCSGFWVDVSCLSNPRTWKMLKRMGTVGAKRQTTQVTTFSQGPVGGFLSVLCICDRH